MGEDKETMAWRNFSLNIHSAGNLPDVREVFETKAYAEVSIGSGDNRVTQKTDADRTNGLNPVWNQVLEFKISDRAVVNQGFPMVIKLYCKRKLGDRYIGEVHTTMKELFDQASDKGSSASLSLPIVNGTEQTSGMLSFSYSFGEIFMKKKTDFMKNPGVEVVAEAVNQATTSILTAILS